MRAALEENQKFNYDKQFSKFYRNPAIK